MNLLEFFRALRGLFYGMPQVESMRASKYAGGAAFHLVMRNGRKYRVLVEDE